MYEAARADRQEVAAEMAGKDADDEVNEEVDHQHPHCAEMPGQRIGQAVLIVDRLGQGQAATQGQVIGEGEIE